jgi:LacI family transcriptional regulator
MAKDVSVITHDDELSYLSNSRTEPIFTATLLSVHHAGRLCAERVIAMIANPGSAPEHTLLEAEQTVSRSTGPTPQIAHRVLA